MENDIKEYNKQQNEDRFKNQTNINNTNELNQNENIFKINEKENNFKIYLYMININCKI